MKKYLNSKFDYNEIMDVMDELPLWAAPFGLKLLEFIRYKKNITALDIGFGAGFPLTELAMRLGDSSLVYGIDPWKKAVERTMRKLEAYEINNVKLIEGVAENIPLENNSIDLIVSNNGINNVNDIGKVIAECSRVVKSGGQFVMTMNTSKSMFEFYDALKFILQQLSLDKEIEAINEHIAHKRPAVNSIKLILQENGFRIIDLEYEQFNLRFADGTAMLSHNFIRLAFMDSWVEIIPQDKVEEIFSLTEKELNKLAGLTGGLKLSIPFVLINAVKG